MEATPDDLGAPLLLAVDGGVQPPEYALGQDRCTLGRRGCTVTALSPLVSRHHATIARSGSRFVLTDEGSVNGTYVNGRLISEPYLLANDDLIGLGSSTPLLRFVDLDRTLPSAQALRYDERAMSFRLGGQPLELTPTQFRLLLYLYRHTGEVCTRESCAQAIWGHDYTPGLDASALDQAITSLRGALRAVQPDADLVQNRRGIGYVLVL